MCRGHYCQRLTTDDAVNDDQNYSLDDQHTRTHARTLPELPPACLCISVSLSLSLSICLLSLPLRLSGCLSQQVSKDSDIFCHVSTHVFLTNDSSSYLCLSIKQKQHTWISNAHSYMLPRVKQINKNSFLNSIKRATLSAVQTAALLRDRTP